MLVWRLGTGPFLDGICTIDGWSLAAAAGMEFDAAMPLPERLVRLQERMAAGDPLAAQVYQTIGTYFGYAVAHYADFYDLKHVLILGRVTSGEGGGIILNRSLEVLRVEFPELAARISMALPDEANRRVGQSIAAASLAARQAEPPAPRQAPDGETK